MGQGHTSAEDKISCILHILSSEAWDVAQLLAGLDEFISFTTDLGTEVKVVVFFWAVLIWHLLWRCGLLVVLPDQPRCPIHQRLVRPKGATITPCSSAKATRP